MQPSPPSTPELSPSDRRTLLALARQALEHHLRGGPPPRRTAAGGALERRCGLFVTLRVRGDLAGCIGWVEADEPLHRTVVGCAVAAATQDPRFPPLRAEDLADLRIEVSVLSEAVPVGSPEEIEVGRDGLIVEHAGRRGLLLPQVAPEQGWDREGLLAGVCRKAGLDADAWRTGARLRRFTAAVFAE
jgi:AmmeMemoRadiSam system protein A